jgi:hypothetical protein
MSDVHQDHRTLGALTMAVSRDAAGLVRAELELARAEMAGKARRSASGAGMIAAAAAAGLVALATLTATAVLGLAAFLPAWLAALIVALVLALAAAVAAKLGASRLRAAAPPLPSETVETAKEDVQWVKQRAMRERR